MTIAGSSVWNLKRLKNQVISWMMNISEYRNR